MTKGCAAQMWTLAIVTWTLGAGPVSTVGAQEAPAQAPASATPRADARIDLTGNWVSIVTEDWRFRMVVPEKGDYASIPLTAEGRRVADRWDPTADQASGNLCRAYGVGGVMRMPGRLRIAWNNDTTLKIDADAGTQTRLLRFGNGQPLRAAPDWQGLSVATWEGPKTKGEEPQGGTLKVVTKGMRAGYLRKNGVPYSENAVITEYFHRVHDTDSVDWLVVTTLVDDPKYLIEPFTTSSHFKKEADGSKWSPTPCRVD